MKKVLIILAVCLSFPFAGHAQTRKPVRKAATPVTKTVEPPSANGKFKFDWAKGIINDSDDKDFIVITASGKSTSDIKSSVVSTLSDMYSNPSKVISTLGDNVVNVTGYYGKDVFWIQEDEIIKTYYFTYNIKIEIKDGKIEVCSPSFSNITERRQSGSYVFGTSHVELSDFYSFLRRSNMSNTYLKILTDLFNSHVSNIVKGLSSDSDW